MMAAALALWLGILTSISPCPLASNIAALSFVTKQLDRPRHMATAGVSYALGRSFSYVLLALLVVTAVFSVPYLSLFLQDFVTASLGPLFVLIGMALIGLLPLPSGSFDLVGREAARRLQGKGLIGAFGIGVLLALAFCPISAAIYFGSLVPLSVEHRSALLLPVLYGIGTAVPVLAFAALLAFGARSVAKAFEAASALVRWSTPATGGLFILLGIYLSLVHVFGVL